MITIHCSRACAHLASPPELLTAGMAKAVTVEFVFSDDWSGLTKTAVFSAGRTTVDVLESAWDGNKVVVPHEILADAGPIARVGVYGANEDGLILPTVWVTLGKVMPAAEPSGDPGADPTLPIWFCICAQTGRDGSAEASPDGSAPGWTLPRLTQPVGRTTPLSSAP